LKTYLLQKAHAANQIPSQIPLLVVLWC